MLWNTPSPERRLLATQTEQSLRGCLPYRARVLLEVCTRRVDTHDDSSFHIPGLRTLGGVERFLTPRVRKISEGIARLCEKQLGRIPNRAASLRCTPS